jgi:hypothetical protein
VKFDIGPVKKTKVQLFSFPVFQYQLGTRIWKTWSFEIISQLLLSDDQQQNKVFKPSFTKLGFY